MLVDAASFSDDEKLLLFNPPAPSGPPMKDIIERRTRDRVFLRCAVQLYPSDSSEPFEGETRDLSSAGFYCLLPRPVSQGDHLNCVLTVPAESFSSHAGHLSLQCEVEVIRVDSRQPLYGVACRIDRYSLVLPSEARP